MRAIKCATRLLAARLFVEGFDSLLVGVPFEARCALAQNNTGDSTLELSLALSKVKQEEDE